MRKTVLELFDELFASGEAPPCLVVFPDCFTALGGSQYLDSPATGRYHTYLCDEVVPWVDERYRTLDAPAHRGIMGKSSGGVRRDGDADAPARPLRRARHATRATRSSSSATSASSRSARGRCARSTTAPFERFWEDFRSRPALTRESDQWLVQHLLHGRVLLGGQSCRSTSRRARCAPEVFERWLAWDPVRMVPGHAEALRGLKAIYIDVGLAGRVLPRPRRARLPACAGRDRRHRRLLRALPAATAASSTGTRSRCATSPSACLRRTSPGSRPANESGTRAVPTDARRDAATRLPPCLATRRHRPGSDPDRGATRRPRLAEGQHLELGRRAAQERRDEQQLVGVLGRVGRLEAPARGEPGLELDRSAAARRQRPHRGDSAARDEDRAAEARLDRRDEQAQLGRAERGRDGEGARRCPRARRSGRAGGPRPRSGAQSEMRGEAGAQARQRRRRIVELGGRERAGGERARGSGPTAARTARACPSRPRPPRARRR